MLNLFQKYWFVTISESMRGAGVDYEEKHLLIRAWIAATAYKLAREVADKEEEKTKTTWSIVMMRRV